MTTSISSASDLTAWNGTGTAVLTSDITIDSSFGSSGVVSGTFDGQGHTITRSSSAPNNTQPLFSGITGGTITNFNYDAAIKVPVSAYIMYSASESYGTISYIKITRAAINSGSATTTKGSGGIVGQGSGGNISLLHVLTIENCSVTGTILGSTSGGTKTAGGIAGPDSGYLGVRGLVISGCSVACSVNYGGGIIAGVPEGVGSTALTNRTGATITNCIFRGSLNSYSGGITGPGDGSVVSNCYSYCDSVTADTSFIPGGIIGNNPYQSTVTNCYHFQKINAVPDDNLFFVGGKTNISSYTVPLTACTTDRGAFSSATPSTSLSNPDANCSTNVITSNTTSTQPFSSWPTSYWNIGSTVLNLVLKSFLTDPWQSYTTSGTTPSLNLPIPCLSKGTLIQTPEGEKPIEELKEKDVITTSKGTTTVEKIFSTKSSRKPYLIPQGYYSDVPKRNLYVSPTHGIFINNEWVHAKCSGLFKTADVEETEYYHLKTSNEDDLILAEGITTETFLENGNRCQYCP